MKVLVSADTSSLLTKDVLVKNGISVFPLNVIIDGQEYLDGVSIEQDFLYDSMKANKVIKTSTPPLGQVVEYFEELFKKGYDKVIHFTISSKLSSMYNLFKTVSEEYFDNKVIVIDAYSVSSLMLSHVLYALDEVKNETPVEEIVKTIEERKNDAYIIFVPENLTSLKNGGRISPAIAALGNVLGLKPVIALKEGELVKDTMTRNIKKTFIDRVNEIKDNYPISKYDYSLINFKGNETIVESIKNHINSLFNEEVVIEGLIPINVCAHCGPGTIGLLITPKINNISLSKYL